MRLRYRNWLGETKTQELERHIRVLEASVQSAHDRIDQLDQRLNAHLNEVAK